MGGDSGVAVVCDGCVGVTVVCDGCVCAVVELQRGAGESNGARIGEFHTVYLQHCVFGVVLYLYCEQPFFVGFSFSCVVLLL